MMFRQLLLLVPLFLLAGCGTPSFLVTPVSSSSELEEVKLVSGGGWGGGKIAIIPVEGMLVNAKAGGLLQPTENPVSLFAQQLNQAAADDSVKAIVLRVNTPGGTVSSADAMYDMVIRFKAQTKKPVITSTSEICASGGYYIACASDKIITQPTTVIGSIGVIFNSFDATGTMAKIGLKSDAIKSGPNKDLGSPLKPMGNEEREIMQGLVNEYFDRFKSVVRRHRSIPDDATFTMVTDGRVFSGKRAVELGLADQTGLLEDAIVVAKRAAGAPKASVVSYRRPYAYGGSIYASQSMPQPQSNVVQLQLPGERSLLPSGFYYLWQP